MGGKSCHGCHLIKWYQSKSTSFRRPCLWTPTCLKEQVCACVPFPFKDGIVVECVIATPSFASLPIILISHSPLHPLIWDQQCLACACACDASTVGLVHRTLNMKPGLLTKWWSALKSSMSTYKYHIVSHCIQCTEKQITLAVSYHTRKYTSVCAYIYIYI